MAIDMDYVCLKPLDALAHRYSFVSHIEPSRAWSKIPIATLSFLGASKGHPLVDKILDLYVQYQIDWDYKRFIDSHT